MAAGVVTATAGGVTANGIQLYLRYVTGAAIPSLQTGATQTQTGAAAHEASITTTTTGAGCTMAAIDFVNTSFTADALTTAIGNSSDATNGRQYTGGRQTANVTTPGATTLGFTAPTDNGGLAIVEILPASPGQQISADNFLATSQSAASSTVHSAPASGVAYPSGSLLVAIIAANGGAGVVTMSVSDTQGLTWTELVKSNASGAGYAGVWVAQAPSAEVGTALPYWWSPPNAQFGPNQPFAIPNVITIAPPAGQTLALPVAQVNVAAPAPTLSETLALAVAQENVAAPAPTLGVSLALPVAQENVNALAPTLSESLALPVAQVTVNAPAPTLSESLALPVAQVTVNAPAPTLGVTLSLSVAQVNVNAPAPTVQAGGQVLSLPVAQETVAAPAPGLLNQLALAVATETVAALAPTLSLSLQLAPAQVTVGAPPPTISTGAVALGPFAGGSAAGPQPGGTTSGTTSGGTETTPPAGGSASSPSSGGTVK